MANITKVPNGPLIKRKGPFKGSTLKAGGVVKKAQTGVSMAKRDSIKAANKARIDSTMNARAKKFGFKTQDEYFEWQKKRSKGADQPCGTPDSGSKKGGSCGAATALQKRINKNGGMIKRADGSMSKRGLWDNIRKNKGSGKKPTAEMLKQERKIKKAQTGGSLGTIYTGPAKTNPGVLKARADKAKANANIAAYKKKIKAKK
jgi:hypothetical protein